MKVVIKQRVQGFSFDYMPGEVREVDDAEAMNFIRAGWAERCGADAAVRRAHGTATDKRKQVQDVSH